MKSTKLLVRSESACWRGSGEPRTPADAWHYRPTGVTVAERLGQLLGSMQPSLHPGAFVFCGLGPNEELDSIDPVLEVADGEGRTVVIPAGEAVQGWCARPRPVSPSWGPPRSTSSPSASTRPPGKVCSP